MLIESSICYDSDETEIRFPFYRSFSTFRNIFRGLCTQVFYFYWHVVRGDLRSFVSENQKSYNPNSIYNQIFSKFN